MKTAETLSVNELAGMADVVSPDSATSPGGEWLDLVARSMDDLAGYDDIEEGITEIADGCVPIYTHNRWQVYVDLGAYTEDVTEFGPIEDMEQAAGIALYLIAERLLTALIDESVTA